MASSSEQTNTILLQLLNEFTSVKSSLSDLKTTNKKLEFELNQLKEQKEEEFFKKVEESKIPDYRSIKPERMDVSETMVKSCLKHHSINGDSHLVKHYYIDKSKYKPFEIIKRGTWKYYGEKGWTIDIEGNHIMKIISRNIQLAYMRINKIENYDDKLDEFHDNQKHISELRNERYQKKLLSGIRDILKYDMLPIV